MLMTKSYIWKNRNKRWVVLPNTVVNPVSAGLLQSERLTNKETIILVTREMFIWTYDVVLLFFFVQYFSYTIIKWNRCILKAQQIQNIIKEYDNITQKNTNKWWYFDILYELRPAGNTKPPGCSYYSHRYHYYYYYHF